MKDADVQRIRFSGQRLTDGRTVSSLSEKDERDGP